MYDKPYQWYNLEKFNLLGKQLEQILDENPLDVSKE